MKDKEIKQNTAITTDNSAIKHSSGVAEKKAQKNTVPKKTKKEVSLEAPVYNQKGTSSGKILLPESVFGVKWNNDLVHQVVTSMLSNKRSGTAHTKDRGEVSGGGKKPWKQKGTGRARHGSSRSPIWVGGGTTHGPRSEKDYGKKINKKMRAKALYAILSRKYSDGNVILVESLEISAPKTKDAAAVLSSLSKVDGFSKINSKKKTATLIALPEINESIKKSFANLPGATLIPTKDISALMAMNANHIVFVDPKKSVEVLEAKMK